jgi:hypothetical protein
VQLSNSPPKFVGNYLNWPVVRQDRTFRVHVVEPRIYQPSIHSDIFEATLNVLVSRQADYVDTFRVDRPTTPAEHFDLVTFPEAFLPADRLLVTLNALSGLDSVGCVHVGLRPSTSDVQHLFSVAELKSLVSSIKNVGRIVLADLLPFSNWLEAQQPHLKFNVGCLFTIDANQNVRVCLHPKLVRSKFEFSPLEEDHMEEATLLTVVTLRPSDKKLLTVTIQPLLCSDALHLDTDRSNSRPLEAMHSDAECLGDDPPDHIDIVSVATCSPQNEPQPSHAVGYRTWKPEFKTTFERAASDASLSRHHFSTFILANFGMVPKQKPAGLSGAFVPTPVSGSFPGFVSISCWGWQNDNVERRWSRPDEDCSNWTTTQGYIASLNPFSDGADAVARIFGFTLAKLPRDMSRWRSQPGIVRCGVRIGEYRGTPSSLAFVG